MEKLYAVACYDSRGELKVLRSFSSLKAAVSVTKRLIEDDIKKEILLVESVGEVKGQVQWRAMEQIDHIDQQASTSHHKEPELAEVQSPKAPRWTTTDKIGFLLLFIASACVLPYSLGTGLFFIGCGVLTAFSKPPSKDGLENQKKLIELAGKGNKEILLSTTCRYSEAKIKAAVHSRFSAEVKCFAVVTDQDVSIFLANDPERQLVIEKSRILSCDTFEIDAPYIMNLNFAALYANEMAIKQAKSLSGIVVQLSSHNEGIEVIKLNHFPPNFLTCYFFDLMR